MSKKLSANEICNLLEVLVGLTEPQGETAIDDKVEQNVKHLYILVIGYWMDCIIQHGTEKTHGIAVKQ